MELGTKGGAGRTDSVCLGWLGIVGCGESWYTIDNSATDGIFAYLGRKGRETGAEKLRNANPKRLKELTAIFILF